MCKIGLQLISSILDAITHGQLFWDLLLLLDDDDDVVTVEVVVGDELFVCLFWLRMLNGVDIVVFVLFLDEPDK